MSQLMTGGSGVATIARVRPKTARPEVGGYALSRRLGWGRCGERWLAHLEPSREAYVACRIDGEQMGGDRRAVREFVGRWKRLSHPHAVAVESCVVDEGRDPWVIMPYTGDADGLVTLAELLSRRGGQLGLREAVLAGEQLLSLSAWAHNAGIVHGRIGADEVIVDRSGKLGVELYGLRHGFASAAGEARVNADRDEVRSIVELVFELATGVPASVLNARRARGVLCRGSGRRGKRLAAWLERGLGVEGFAGAEAALAALPR